MNTLPDPLASRRADHPIEPLFLKRWSPRSMSGDAVRDEELMSLFEAARWAPSTFNEQEWRFLYAKRDTPNWQIFFDLLMDANKAWCHRAGVLLVVLSHKVFARTICPRSFANERTLRHATPSTNSFAKEPLPSIRNLIIS